MDLANVIRPNEKQVLDQMIRSIYAQGGPQVTILTVQNLQELAIEDFSMKVVEKWKLGSEKEDNGLLILAAMSERKMRIEVGGGIEGDITDLETNRWIRNILTPAFRQNQFGAGFQAVIAQVAQKYNVPLENRPIVRRNQRPQINLLPIILLIGGLLVIGTIFRSSPMKRGIVSSIFGGGFILLSGGTIFLAIVFLFVFFGIGMMGVQNLLLLLASGHGRSGGGGFGGGGAGWGGGGGGFSGGGSSGSW